MLFGVKLHQSLSLFHCFSSDVDQVVYSLHRCTNDEFIWTSATYKVDYCEDFVSWGKYVQQQKHIKCLFCHILFTTRCHARFVKDSLLLICLYFVLYCAIQTQSDLSKTHHK